MRTRWFFGTATVSACVWLAAGVGLQGAKPLSSEVPLIMSLRSIAATDGLLSDGGTYTSGERNVRAELLPQSNGNFVADTNDKAGIDGGRRLWIDFHGQAGPYQSSPAFPADVFIGTLPVDPNNPDNLLAMTAGQTLQRRTRIGWDDGAEGRGLRWDGLDGHGFLNFKCNQVEGTTCKEWTVTPGGTAGLYSTTTSKGKTTESYYGSFTMSFEMTLTRKP
jgi:hypothetical protein